MDKMLKVKDKEYKLRLTSWEIKNLEEREGKGLLKIMTEMESDGSITTPIVKILHASLQHYNKDMHLQLVFDIYDGLVEHEGYDVEKFGKLIEDILKSAGLFSGKTQK